MTSSLFLFLYFLKTVVVLLHPTCRSFIWFCRSVIVNCIGMCSRINQMDTYEKIHALLHDNWYEALTKQILFLLTNQNVTTNTNSYRSMA